MSNAPDTSFAIIVNERMQFDIWPTGCELMPGWIYVGPTGTHEAMKDILRPWPPPARRRKAARAKPQR